MDKKYFKHLGFLLITLLLLEVISLFGFKYPGLGVASFFVIAFLAVALSVYKLEYGLFFVLTELIVGSKGYLFFLSLQEGRLLSLRLVVWSLFMLVFTVRFALQLKKSGRQSEYWRNIQEFSLLKPFLFLAGTVIIGLITAVIYKNPLLNVFLDFNGWLYFILLIPLIALKPSRRFLSLAFLTGSIWISLKTIILLSMFAHDAAGVGPLAYSWLRKTLVGEMTSAGGWNRVFIQSQIFPAIAYFFLAFRLSAVKRFKELFQPINLITLFVLGLFFATVIISLSRSFWVGFAAAFGVSVLLLLIKKEWRRSLKMITILLASAGLALLLIFAVSPKEATTQLDDRLAERVSNQGEAAVASRWALLPEIFSEIKHNPIIGQGFGATVTYFSSDPRILAVEPSGRYTTYAFEWGYLDIWLKLGILGLIAYFWLFYVLGREAWRSHRLQKDDVYLALMAAWTFLIAIHMFTPYLNHPLGIGFIVASSCLIRTNRVY